MTSFFLSFKLEKHKKYFLAGAVPWNPLGKLTTLPQILSHLWRGTLSLHFSSPLTPLVSQTCCEWRLACSVYLPPFLAVHRRIKPEEIFTIVFNLQVTHTFSSLKKNIRYIYVEHGGKDTQFWMGHYGPKMTATSVMVKCS